MRFSRHEFESFVRDALRDIPQDFQQYLQDVAVVVEDQPDEQTCRDMELDDPTELMGMYDGTPMTERSIDDPAMLPDRIVLYQAGIEAAANAPEEIIEEIQITVLHEIGHHFGLGEDELEALGYD